MKLFRFLINISICALILTGCKLSIPSINSSLNYVISSSVNLNGDTLKLPPNKRLFFMDGACLINGVVLGSQTSIAGNQNKIFKKVKIAGTWNVPTISTSMFSDIHEDNALKNLFALTSPTIKNTVLIGSGDYWLSASRDWQSQIQLVSNTDVFIEGVVRLRPNKYRGYYLFNLKGDNISLSGNGAIIGDKENHFGIEGEWGMGINISSGTNIKISNLTIKDCWGDCIYVGGDVDKVSIDRCCLDGSRRQGISITSARRVYISDCVIKNIAGTAPEFAVDIEPNAGKTVEYVSIRNVKAINCNGGFMSWHPNKSSRIGTIEIYNCSVLGNVKHHDYSFELAENVIMKNNQGVGKKIRLIANTMVKLENNSIKNQKNSSYLISNCKKVTKK